MTCWVDNVALSRVVDKKGNRYHVGDETYNALRGKIPQAALDLLRMPQVCWQSQHDGPFWLGQTPTQVGRQLCEVVDLDTVLKAIEVSNAKVLHAQAVGRHTEKENVEAKAAAQALEWVPEANADWLAVGAAQTLHTQTQQAASVLRTALTKTQQAATVARTQAQAATAAKAKATKAANKAKKEAAAKAKAEKAAKPPAKKKPTKAEKEAKIAAANADKPDPVAQTADVAAVTAAPTPKPKAADAPKAAWQKGAPGVRPQQSGRSYQAGVIIRERGLEAGVTDELVALLDERVGKANPVQSKFDLASAWHTLNGYINGGVDTETPTPADD